MAAPVIASTASAVVDGPSSISCNKPAGTASGDVLYASICCYLSDSITVSTPSGWTLVRGPDRRTGSAQIVGYLFRKVAGGSEPASYTFSASQSTYLTAWIARVTGADTTTPEDASTSGNNGTGSPRTGLGITTSGADRLLLLCSLGFGVAPNATPSGMTQVEIVDTVQGYYSQTIASAGATGNRSHTQNSGSDPTWVTQMVAIRPAAGASERTGNLSVSLGAATAASAAAAAVSISAAQTLAPVTPAGQAQGAVAGGLAATLAAALPAGQGATGVSAAAAAALGDVGAGGAGALAVASSFGVALAADALSGTSAGAIAAALAWTLDPAALAATATQNPGNTAALSAVLGPANPDGLAAAAVVATAALNAGPAALGGTAAMVETGSLAISLQAQSVLAQAAVAISAEVIHTLGPAIPAAAGAARLDAALSATLGGAVGGLATSRVAASLSASFAAMTLAGGTAPLISLPPASRIWAVAAERRIVAVAPEARALIVPAESRTLRAS